MKSSEIPVDEIFKLKEEFEKDPRKNKINGGIGVYLDQFGKPYVHPTVKLAIKRLPFDNFNYLPLSGSPIFLKETTRLVLGESMFNYLDPYTAKQGTVGGTNGIYMWARLIKELDKKPTVIIGHPTWENHIRMFLYFGFTIIKYPHLTKNKKFNLKNLKKKLIKYPKAYVLFQAGPCHNPTGLNPNNQEWRELAKIIKTNKQEVLFDYAYLGLGDNIDSDSFCVRHFTKNRIPTSIAVSYSKNMTLYKQRAAALLILCSSKKEKEQTEKLLQYIFRLVNTNPPAFGEEIVRAILQDRELKTKWIADLNNMLNDLNLRRELFIQHTQGKFDYLKKFRGLFGFLFLSPKQVDELKKKHAIYILSNSRINFGGIAINSISKVANAVLSVI